jgi:hypothetical protein
LISEGALTFMNSTDIYRNSAKGSSEYAHSYAITASHIADMANTASSTAAVIVTNILNCATSARNLYDTISDNKIALDQILADVTIYTQRAVAIVNELEGVLAQYKDIKETSSLVLNQETMN